jgi:hypothetical protein
MMRACLGVCTLAALFIFVGGVSAADKPQMVKGTIESAEPSKDLLVINQKLKTETVKRELSIEPTTTFMVTINGEKKTLVGRQGLEFLLDKKGASVNVKCDKDVKVLSVSVK